MGDSVAIARSSEIVILSEIGLSGARLRALRERPETQSPLPGILDVEPSLHVISAPAKTGKTSFAHVLALSWSQGLSPWVGAPRLPKSRVLFLSKEQSARKIDRVMRRITETAHLGDVEGWTDQITILANDQEIDTRILTLDDPGLKLVNQGLHHAREVDDPYGLMVIDSLSRVKPATVGENDNDTMAAWLSKLADTAIEREIYIWLIHHDGHTSAERATAIGAMRGASAIGQAAQVALHLERVTGSPYQRKLVVQGNEMDNVTWLFQVADRELGEPKDHVNRFELVDLQLPDGWESWFDGGELLTLNALALRLGESQGKSCPPGTPASGHLRKQVGKVLEEMEKLNKIKKVDGKWMRVI